MACQIDRLDQSFVAPKSKAFRAKRPPVCAAQAYRQSARLRHIVLDRLMQLFEIITWNTRIQVMLRVPIHMPIEKQDQIKNT